jgi:phytoene dehydrogenase-like protein
MAGSGGGVVTRELTLPGFRHDQHSMAHIFIHANPLLAADELKLKEKIRAAVRISRPAHDVGVRGRQHPGDPSRPRAHLRRDRRNSPGKTPTPFAGSRSRPAAWLPMIVADPV